MTDAIVIRQLQLKTLCGPFPNQDYTMKHSHVNDGINPTICSLTYITVDQVAAVAAPLGVGSLLAKIDIQSAYTSNISRIDRYWGFSGGA